MWSPASSRSDNFMSASTRPSLQSVRVIELNNKQHMRQVRGFFGTMQCCAAPGSDLTVTKTKRSPVGPPRRPALPSPRTRSRLSVSTPAGTRRLRQQEAALSIHMCGHERLFRTPRACKRSPVAILCTCRSCDCSVACQQRQLLAVDRLYIWVCNRPDALGLAHTAVAAAGVARC